MSGLVPPRRPESEIYRDGFHDGIAAAQRAVQVIEDTFQVIGVDRDNDVRASLRGLIEAFDWALQSANTDQAIAHWKALQAENT